MASVSGVNCETCNYRHVENPAAHWCPECEEGLCAECYQHHTHSKTSRYHGVIPMSDYEKLPIFIQDIKHYCREHDEKYEYYCPAHKCPCCKKSSNTEHKSCKGLLPIGDVTHGIKNSEKFKEMDDNIENTKIHIERILKDRETNLKEIRDKGQKIQTEVKEMRIQLISHLDALENDIQEKLSTIEEKVATEFENFITELTEQKDSVVQLQEKIEAIKTHASEFQTFLGMEELKAEVESKEKYIQSLADDNRTDKISISHSIEEKIKAFLADILKFGDVSTERSPNTSMLAVAKPKVKDVQTPIPDVQKSKNSKPTLMVQAKIKRKITVPPGKNKNTITGCTILPNGKFVFVDGTYNQRVVILNSNGTTSGEISLAPSFAFDVTCIDAKTIAISTGSSGQIVIANVLSKKIKKVIGTTWQYDGLCHINGKLIFAVYAKGVHMLHLESGSITSIHSENITVDTHVTAFGNRIYHTNWKTNTVTCYNIDGKTIWTYQDENILKKPRGITVDDKQNLYVACLGTDCVLVISPDGKQGRQLQIEKDDIENLRAIYFDTEKNSLLVSTLSGSAFLFDMI